MVAKIDYIKYLSAIFCGTVIISSIAHRVCPGKALNFSSGRGVWPGFPKCELIFVTERGVL